MFKNAPNPLCLKDRQNLEFISRQLLHTLIAYAPLRIGRTTKKEANLIAPQSDPLPAAIRASHRKAYTSIRGTEDVRRNHPSTSEVCATQIAVDNFMVNTWDGGNPNKDKPPHSVTNPHLGLWGRVAYTVNK
jgi:hypothetical protein